MSLSRAGINDGCQARLFSGLIQMRLFHGQPPAGIFHALSVRSCAFDLLIFVLLVVRVAHPKQGATKGTSDRRFIRDKLRWLCRRASMSVLLLFSTLHGTYAPSRLVLIQSCSICGPCSKPQQRQPYRGASSQHACYARGEQGRH